MLKDEIIKEIMKRPFPVISITDFADASAIIYVNEHGGVYVGEYGTELLEDGVVTSTSEKQFEDGSLELSDLTDYGLLNVLHGSRPSDASWEDDEFYIIDCGWKEEE